MSWLGQEQLRQDFDWARSGAWAEGAGAVILDIVKGNARAQACYARNGFKLTGHEKPGARDGLMEVEMRKNLR